MSVSSDYHLGELRVALDPSHPSHVLPPKRPSSEKVLDIGCGAGQTLIAVYPDRVSFGLDIDLEAIRLGGTLTKDVRFACGTANALPYRAESFDMVVSRVTLLYSNLAVSLPEIRRVLRPGGQVWITLHPFSRAWKTARGYRSIKAWIKFGYILANSLLYHLVQKQFPFLGRYESFQTERGLRRGFEHSGFDQIEIQASLDRFVITARAC